MNKQEKPLCKCGCGKPTSGRHLREKNRRVQYFGNHYFKTLEHKHPPKPSLCKCGCGQMTNGIYDFPKKKYREYIQGHHLRVKRKPETQRNPSECKCGCGGMTQGWFNYHTKKYSEYIKGHERRNKPKRWSENYDCCTNCGTTETKYARKGLCQNCDYHINRKNDSHQRTQRSYYFAKYYVEKKRDSGYYEQYRRSNSAYYHAAVRRANQIDDPDLKLYALNRAYLLIVLDKPCEVCGTKVKREIDHIKQRKDGGTSELSNLRVLCITHHRSVGTGRHSVLKGQSL